MSIVEAPPADTDDVARSEIISELEKEDGDSSLAMFAQGKKIPRVSTSQKKAADDLDADPLTPGDEDATSDAMAAFYKMPPAKGIDSKLVYLSDILPPVPSKGDFDLEKIRHSLYFFSVSQKVMATSSDNGPDAIASIHSDAPSRSFSFPTYTSFHARHTLL